MNLASADLSKIAEAFRARQTGVRSGVESLAPLPPVERDLICVCTSDSYSFRAVAIRASFLSAAL